MLEQDSLSGFDFSKVSKPGKFLKFQADTPVTIRILTKDPIVSEATFAGSEMPVARFNFIVWNFTDDLAQILSVGANMAKTFQRVGKDEDFGANLQACDIKISPEGEKLQRVYDINVLRHSGSEKQLTGAMVNEAKAIDMDKEIQNNKGRLSEWEPAPTPLTDAAESGYAKARSQADELRSDDIEDEQVDLSDVPF